MRLICVALLIFNFNLAQAKLTASADRTHLRVGETIRLELSIDRATEAMPDLSQLSEEFVVLDIGRIQVGSSNRETTHYETRWQISISPRSTEVTAIPPLQLLGERTPALSLTVAPPEQQQRLSLTRATGELYPDQPLVVTLSYLSDNQPAQPSFRLLPDNNLSFRALEDLQQIQQSTGWLTRQSFALFFSQPGEQRTPLIEIRSGDQLLEQLPGELISVQTPAYRSQQARWFPASKLELDDSWQRLTAVDSGAIPVRELRLQATGPLPATIPALPLPDQFERIDTELSEQRDPLGVISQRIERWRYIGTAQDLIRTAATELLWWDSDAQQTRVLTLPAHQFLIQKPAIPATEPAAVASDRSLMLLAALLALLNLLGVGYLWRQKGQLRALIAEREQLEASLDQVGLQLGEHRTFLALLTACERDQAETCAQLLVDWGSYLWPDEPPNSLESFSTHSTDTDLNLILFQLAEALNTDRSAVWRGELLLQRLKPFRRAQLSPQADLAPDPSEE